MTSYLQEAEMEPNHNDLLKIKAFASDVDGVMTDGGILCDLEGQLYRTFSAKDGFAIRMATMNGFPFAVITGGRSASIRERVKTAGVKDTDIYLGSRDKESDFMDFCSRHGLRPEEVMYFGDDVPDIGTMQMSGMGVCPADAAEDVLAMADFVSPFCGGKGCIRDMVERVMKAHGSWVFDSVTYKKLF